MRRGLSVLLVLGVAAAPLTWVAPASAAATWLPEVTASGDVVDVSQVEVAADPAGNATAVWSAQVDARARRAADGDATGRSRRLRTGADAHG